MNMKEKRATDRFKPVKAITVALESDEDLPTGFGTVADISVGGACVITDVRLDVDAKPRLALSFPNQLSYSSHRTVFTTGNVFNTAGGLPSITNKLSEYATSIIANSANLAGVNERRSETQRSLVEALQFKSDSVRGVNLDEEMADLIVFEQSFAAAARVIAVIQNMIKALERAIG